MGSWSISEHEKYKEACWRYCIGKYKTAVIKSVLFECISLIFFLLIINWNPFQLLIWYVSQLSKPHAARIMMFVPTVLSILSVVILVFINGLFVAYKYFKPPPTANRNRLSTALQKILRLIVTAASGIWFVSVIVWFIPEEYNAGWLTTLIGLCAAFRFLYHNADTNLVFPIIPEPEYLRVKRATIQMISNYIFRALIPSIVTWILIVTVVACLSFDLSLFGRFIGIRMLWYVWLEYAYVSTSLAIIKDMFNISLTECHLGLIWIEKGQFDSEIPLVEMLKALDLNAWASDANSSKARWNDFTCRGYRYRWMEFSDLKHRYLVVLKQLTQELNDILIDKKTEDVKVKSQIPQNFPDINSPVVHRTTYRDLNETLGIRNLLASPAGINPYSNQQVEEQALQKPLPMLIISQFEAFVTKLMKNIRDTLFSKIFYEEDKSQKVNTFITRHFQLIIWLYQAFAWFTVHSLTEDKIGIVKPYLGEIFKQLVEVHQTIEQVNTMNLVKKREDRNYVALRSATRMGLYRIRQHFEKYFDEMIIHPDVADYIRANVY